MNHYVSGREPSEAYRAACGNHRDNAAVASDAGVKTLVLTHLLPELDRPEVREQASAEIRAIFPGEVIWAADLRELTAGG